MTAHILTSRIHEKPLFSDFTTLRISMTDEYAGFACGLTFLVPRDSSKMNVNNVSHRLLRILLA